MEFDYDTTCNMCYSDVAVHVSEEDGDVAIDGGHHSRIMTAPEKYLEEEIDVEDTVTPHIQDLLDDDYVAILYTVCGSCCPSCDD